MGKGKKIKKFHLIWNLNSFFKKKSLGFYMASYFEQRLIYGGGAIFQIQQILNPMLFFRPPNF